MEDTISMSGANSETDLSSLEIREGQPSHVSPVFHGFQFTNFLNLFFIGSCSEMGSMRDDDHG